MPTPSERVKSILDQYDQLAIVVGNGINRYSSPNQADYGWDRLVESLWNGLSANTIPIGNDLSLTEAYDIISLSSEGDSELVERVKTFVDKIESTKYQGELCGRMRNRGLPVLTTNFDRILEKSITGLSRYKLKHPNSATLSFTDFYPWNVYYSDNELANPIDGFGIWHINGTVEYPRSMRLGLTQYMNQVSRVRSFIHSADTNENYVGKNQNTWKGFNTWLHIIFNCPLLVFGLALDVNETFLRWLLIEREKYFVNFPDRRKAGWYLCQKDEVNQGKQFFLLNLGFEIIAFDDFADLYESLLQ